VLWLKLEYRRMTPRFTLKVFAVVARLYQPAFRMQTKHGSRVYSTSLL
jgi:hypothetical protein